MSGITNIARDWGFDPAIVRIATTDTLATITTTGYLLTQEAQIFAVNSGAFEWAVTDYVLVYYSDNGGSWGFFQYVPATGSLTAAPTVPGSLANTLPSGDIFVGNGSNIATGVAMTGAVAITNAGVTSLVAPIAMTDTTASATPGTIRAFKSVMQNSNSVMTSGNLVGVRGEVDYVGASGGFLYGVQGKIIPTGTISGSSWNAGVFGQLDISAATINAGQMAPIWGDYGATSHTLTDQTGLYGIAMTNTTAAVLEGQLYLYGGAQNLMYLSTNAGLSGVTYFKTSGTSAGSWGNATPPTPSKVLKISVDGTAYYIPLVAQNT